jgi:phage terminase small subunit
MGKKLMISTKAPIKPPSFLGKKGRNFFNKTAERYNFYDQHGIELLTHAAEVLDRLEELRKRIDGEGLLVANRFGELRENPAVKVERDQKILFARLVRELNFDTPEEEEYTRPPRFNTPRTA